jgi:hypothetical protein
MVFIMAASLPYLAILFLFCAATIHHTAMPFCTGIVAHASIAAQRLQGKSLVVQKDDPTAITEGTYTEAGANPVTVRVSLSFSVNQWCVSQQSSKHFFFFFKGRRLRSASRYSIGTASRLSGGSFHRRRDFVPTVGRGGRYRRGGGRSCSGGRPARRRGGGWLGVPSSGVRRAGLGQLRAGGWLERDGSHLGA